MKKIVLLLICVAVTVGASAQVKSKGNAYRPMDKVQSSTKVQTPSRVDIITEQPEGTLVNYLRGGEYLLSSFYGYDTDYQTGRVRVVYADDGHTVYIQDIMCYGEGSGVWVEGELNDDGSTISVPLGQYIAYNEEFGYGVVLSWGTTDVIDLGDDFYWLDFIADERATEVTYAIDPETGVITMLGSDGSVDNPYPYNCVATGLAGLWSDDGSVATIEWNSVWTPMGETVAAVPANPDVLEFYDCGDESGYTRFDFNINLVDVDGNPLNSDYLTYSVFTDEDQLFMFDVETYGAQNGFDTDMTEIPYGYSGEDFYLRRVYFYRTNEGDNPMFNWRIGIQLNYTVDGVTNKSDIVYLEVYPKPSAVNELADGKTVAGVRYFNMAGQEMAQPEGMTIQVTTYSDGTTSAVKVMK
ncbi:MAG: hypothetical protein IJG42_03510 [Muribaculaceae bacterium]|nr:hypothetical protein [Muribaculaceae bacterium]